MTDFLFIKHLSELDPDLNKLTILEGERQGRRLNMIPSESSAPFAVRELMASPFNNIYAEGTRCQKRARKARQKSWITPANSALTGAIATCVITRASNMWTSSRRSPAAARLSFLPPICSFRTTCG